MQNRVFMFSALSLALTLCAPAFGGASRAPIQPSVVLGNTPAPESDHAIGILTTDNLEYRRGDPVRFHFVVKNVTHGTVHYDFESGRQFDIAVTDSRGIEVWRWSRGHAFAEQLTAFDLKPGDSKAYTATWMPTAATGVFNAVANLTPAVRPAVRGGITFNPDTDPNNMGTPTVTKLQSGSVVEVNVTPSVSASVKVKIGVR
jgi:hypothetical protein